MKINRFPLNSILLFCGLAALVFFTACANYNTVKAGGSVQGGILTHQPQPQEAQKSK